MFCLFCGEENDLIDLNKNSVIIESVYIEFYDLISDLFRLKIQTNEMMCHSCKDHLSQFYIMKQRAKIQLSTPKDIRKIQVENSVSEFLDSIDEECVVSIMSKMLVVHVDVDDINFNDQLSYCNQLISDTTNYTLECEDQEIYEEVVETETLPQEDENDLENQLKIIAQSTEKKMVPNIIQCSKCDFTTNQKSKLRSHESQIHGTLAKKPTKHSCFQCNLRFESETLLKVHKNCHKIIESIAPYSNFPTCECCSMTFLNDQDRDFHTNKLHDGNEDSKLSQIGIVFKNGDPFRDENEKEIDEIKRVAECGYCSKYFTDETDCRRHLMLFHATSFICPFDARQFDGTPTLSFGNHLRQCHPEVFSELEIACSFCNMKFETVYDKISHMKKCSAKRYICDHCGKSFFKKSKLLNHLKIVTGLIIIACDICGKKCKDQGDLKVHIRSHTTQRPYPCPFCEKTYKTSSARASHIETHMERNHCCTICDAKFRRRILYQRHMKLMHDESYRMKCFAENTCKTCNKSYLRRSHFLSHLKIHNKK